jgi:menaquinone-9 beta-reductase
MQWPDVCDVLVIGAGPAGSACTQALAREGVDVVLVDQHDFPRDKVCGDGLIPDAHAAFARLGVLDAVRAVAQPVRHVRCVAPRGGHVDVPGEMAVLPRRQLDEILRHAALRAGARWVAPARFEAPLIEGERVVGARLRRPGGDRGERAALHELRARWVVLATGAVPQALIAAGMCDRQTPTGVALRGYASHEGLAGVLKELHIVWHPKLRGGYGWIFPAPGGLFNIGVGLTASHDTDRGGHGRRRGQNLRAMLDTFGAVYPLAAELLAHGRWEGEIKGAPLRCSLQGARWSRPGLLVTGEAAGSTYALTGEGIGKAMETGLLAAEAILSAHCGDQGRAPGPASSSLLAGSPSDTPPDRSDRAPDAGSSVPASEGEVRTRYEAALRALKPRFDVYDAAGRVNEYPWLADLVIWRARRSPRILRRMQGILDETQRPTLLTWRGMSKLLLE